MRARGCRSALLALALLGACGWAQAEPAASGNARPAFGLLDADEGTVEFRIRVRLEPEALGGGYRGFGNVFEYRTGAASA